MMKCNVATVQGFFTELKGNEMWQRSTDATLHEES